MATATRSQILEQFELFQGGTGGLDSWLGDKTPQGDETPQAVFDVLADLENRPLTQARMNQSLTLVHEAPISHALFRYYWLSVPDNHPYNVRNIPNFKCSYGNEASYGIASLNQLYWGLYRFYVDALLFFGNVRTAYQRLRRLSENELSKFYRERCIDTDGLKRRGQPIHPEQIAKGDRYLISEMACKSLDAETFAACELATTLLGLYRRHCKDSNDQVTAGQLLDGAKSRGEIRDTQPRLYLSADEFLDDPITDEDDLLGKIERVSRTFDSVRKTALANTQTYLSMVGDLDIYVATSMRTRLDFHSMSTFCEKVFSDPALKDFNLRYFDPTLSAAKHHEDKGIIECLMVKLAKVLVLQAGPNDSYGKDAEAAMALSLGKPVIIHADDEARLRFFMDIHPLSRLINFETGVAIGAMIANSQEQVIELLERVFSNSLEYELCQPRPKYLVLKEKITRSEVRLQTSDDLIRETFWNHYHNDVR